MDQSEEPQQWTGRSRGGRWGHWIFIQMVRRIGLLGAYALLVPVTAYMFLTAPAARRASQAYLRRAGMLDQRTGALRRIWIMYRHFFMFGILLVDRLAALVAPNITFDFEEDGVEHIEQALSHPGGVILLSAHFGNWEVASRAIAVADRKLNVVAYQGESKPIRDLLEASSVAQPFEIIEVDGSANSTLQIHEALRRHEIVAMHGDRSLDGTGIPTAVLGDPVALPPGPFVLAATSDAVLVQTFAIRLGRGRYRLIAYPPQDLQFTTRAQRQDDLARWAQVYADRLESCMTQAPLQWWNFYDYWQEEVEPADKEPAGHV